MAVGRNSVKPQMSNSKEGILSSPMVVAALTSTFTSLDLLPFAKLRAQMSRVWAGDCASAAYLRTIHCRPESLR